MESIDRTRFTVIGLSDPQEYARSRPDIFMNQTKWIKENVDSLNIKFVFQPGDLVDSGKSATQWNVIDRSMDVLDGAVPYLVTMGDHDYDSGNSLTPGMRSSVNYNTYMVTIDSAIIAGLEDIIQKTVLKIHMDTSLPQEKIKTLWLLGLNIVQQMTIYIGQIVS